MLSGNISLTKWKRYMTIHYKKNEYRLLIAINIILYLYIVLIISILEILQKDLFSTCHISLRERIIAKGLPIGGLGSVL